MKQKIYVKKDNKPIFKIVIDNSKIDIYEKICGIYKYRRINYSITNYNNIYLGYSPCKLKKYKNSFDIIETIDYRYSYEYNNKSIESILIEMSNNPYTYISIFQNVFMFKLDEPVIKYNLLHNICHHKLFSNKYIIVKSLFSS